MVESVWIEVEVSGILCDKTAENEVHTEKQVHVRLPVDCAVWISWF